MPDICYFETPMLNILAQICAHSSTKFCLAKVANETNSLQQIYEIITRPLHFHKNVFINLIKICIKLVVSGAVSEIDPQIANI